MAGSWTFRVVNPAGQTITAVLRKAEFNDTDSKLRRQSRVVTEAGLVYVQDHDNEDRFIEASWGFMKEDERADIEFFFGPSGTLRQARAFEIDIADTSFPTRIKAGAVVGGSPVTFGQVVNPPDVVKFGEFIRPDTINLRNVFLDQDDLVFTQERNERYSLDLRFRIAGASSGV